MAGCYRRFCKRTPEDGTLFLSGDGVSPIPVCKRHARSVRLAADLVGGEPVYDFTEWLRLAGSFGGPIRLFRKPRPRLLQPGEQVKASGTGFLLPLLSTMSIVNGTAIATSNSRILVVNHGRIVFEVPWRDIDGYSIGPGTVIAGGNARKYLQLTVSADKSSYMLWVEQQNEDEWLRELHTNKVPRHQ